MSRTRCWVTERDTPKENYQEPSAELDSLAHGVSGARHHLRYDFEVTSLNDDAGMTSKSQPLDDGCSHDFRVAALDAMTRLSSQKRHGNHNSATFIMKARMSRPRSSGSHTQRNLTSLSR